MTGTVENLGFKYEVEFIYSFNLCYCFSCLQLKVKCDGFYKTRLSKEYKLTVYFHNKIF